MFKLAYPFTLVSAILLGSLVLTSCGGGNKRSTIHVDQQKEKDAKAAAEAKRLAAIHAEQQHIIDQLVSQAQFQAQLENPDTTALNQLQAMSQDPNIPVQSQGQAALQYAELLFEYQRPEAFQVNEETVEQWLNHPYLPHMYNMLAKQWISLENPEAAMKNLSLALQEPQVDPYTLAENIELSDSLFELVSQESKLDWLLAVSKHDTNNQDMWLKRAAAIASLDDVLQLRHSTHPLSKDQTNFYRYFARERLMVGDYHTVRLTAKILENDMPDSEVYDVVKAWADSEGNHVIVGVLLPLSGKYAAYGQQALRGIRLAMSRPEFEDNIVLRIVDTQGDAELTVLGYEQLSKSGIDWVLGPLLSSNTQALIPFLLENIPVVALSSHIQLAAESPSLFIHSLTKVVQADFMARHAIKKGKSKAVILHTYSKSAFDEAAAYAQTFINAGGEVLDIIELEKGFRDNRPGLVSMRFRTDDEELLANLDEDLVLFSAEQNMDIKMPLAFDHMYIIIKGKSLAVLAGQLAYAGIRNVQLYGSYRWQDGHLMDDHGLYLGGSEFAAPFTSVKQPNQAVLDVKSQYRIIWDSDDMSPLFTLAYDTAMNIATIGSRMGFKGEDAIDVLHNTDGFPAISGNYYFDERGISQKTFAIQRVRRDRVETIQ